ncbi:MAG: UDP-N-acetylmuramoyl-tripeptide--D-alanyl-D-alanine ligase [Actinobacteria bacterium]|nr:UDP-N-acetylmuramoyl-tripeptide--D-alanyl-D-alanine ligase [Actinomycetota bacterium]
MEMSLQEVAAATDGDVDAADAARLVRTVTTDSRDVGTEALFVALRGESADGHDYIEAALAAGATGYLAETREGDRAPGGVLVADTWTAIARLAGAVRDRVDPTVVAVTGSVGKTTTKDLTAAALRAQLRTVAARGSYNNELGVPLTLLDVESRTQAVVVEIGARGIGHIAALTPYVRPDVSVVTAVAAAHTEQFGDLDAVAQAKGELIEATAVGGAAILNADDERVAAMATRTRATIIRYGWREARDADVRAESVELDDHARASFRARTPWGDADVTVPVAGVHHVGNALATLAVAGHLGVDVAAAADALRSATVSPWRSQLAEAGGVAVLNDAYNANPTSVIAALRTLVELSRRRGGRAIAVLGQMAELGAVSRGAHEQVGREAGELGVDTLVVVAGGDADALASGAGSLAESVADVDAALAVVVEVVRPGDVVLTKASRVAGLEQVADGLLTHLGGEPGP